jgi:hypothetical protein
MVNRDDEKAKKGVVTFIYAAYDQDHDGARVLKEFVEEGSRPLRSMEVGPRSVVEVKNEKGTRESFKAGFVKFRIWVMASSATAHQALTQLRQV